MTEKNDRRIWNQAALMDAVLVTSDRKLLAAVRQKTGDLAAALTPTELAEAATHLP